MQLCKARLRLEVIRRAVHYVQSGAWVTWHELKVILTYTTVLYGARVILARLDGVYHCAVNYLQDCALCSIGCKSDSGKA